MHLHLAVAGDSDHNILWLSRCGDDRGDSRMLRVTSTHRDQPSRRSRREGEGHAHGDGAGAGRDRDPPALHRRRDATRTTRSSGSGATRASRTTRTAPTPSSSPTSSSPSTWSQNATNIVAQKYFRGTLGTPEREWSLRQVIDRVADTITDVGRARRLLRRRRRGRRVPRRAQVRPRAPARRVQLAGVVQHRREGRAAAGERVLHPRGRRHDGRRSSTGTARRASSSRAAPAPASTSRTSARRRSTSRAAAPRAAR